LAASTIAALISTPAANPVGPVISAKGKRRATDSAADIEHLLSCGQIQVLRRRRADPLDVLTLVQEFQEIDEICRCAIRLGELPDLGHRF
jgi:hypothetical protein